MAAYLIVGVRIRDPERFEEYRAMVPATLSPYGGRFLVRGGAMQTLEGDWQPPRMVVLEFPDAERARSWWASPEYAEAKALRQATADTRMVLVEGV
jgi:uncharacterized protein (DUF1330 family)